MSKPEDKYYKRKLRSSYITTLSSITLVLFVLGLLGLIILYAQKVSDYVRENIGFTITLNETAEETAIIRFQKKLEIEDFVKSTRYVSKEEAAEALKSELGEDFIGFLGYNPLLPTIDVQLVAEYATTGHLKKIEQELMKSSIIKRIDYQKSMVKTINENIEKLSIILLAFSLLLMIIAFALINNTIKLSVYSKRFLIRTMQLVGATQGFIRRPFLRQGFVYGLIGSVFTLILLAAVLYFGEQRFPELIDLRDYQTYAILTGTIMLLGIVISYTSTFFAVRKYLNMRTDKLFY
jgi:cell division transport system permease protein